MAPLALQPRRYPRSSIIHRVPFTVSSATRCSVARSPRLPFDILPGVNLLCETNAVAFRSIRCAESGCRVGSQKESSGEVRRAQRKELTIGIKNMSASAFTCAAAEQISCVRHAFVFPCAVVSIISDKNVRRAPSLSHSRSLAVTREPR